MSLDISLYTPDKCPHCGGELPRTGETHSQNITHNLGQMANEAGIYNVLWRPEENGITEAAQLIEPLERAIAEMKADPPRFAKYNAPNGWGLYKNFVPWLERLLEACKRYPEARVNASR